MAHTGEYVVVDLDENNAHTRAEWAKRHPGETPRSFWGVCRQGHGRWTYRRWPSARRAGWPTG
jgi:hypothetical protein